MPTKIVLVTTDQQSNAAIKAAKPDMIEIRVDLFKDLTPAYVVSQIKSRRDLKIPLILTVRNQKKEGASRVLSDVRKKELLNVCLPLVHWVDIELSSPLLKETVKKAHGLKKKVIISVHDFKAMPKNIRGISEKAFKAGADCVKVAATAKTMRDVIHLADVVGCFCGKNVAAMAVGLWGEVSRLILPAAGSFLVYTVLGKALVQGQMDIRTLKAQFKNYGLS